MERESAMKREKEKLSKGAASGMVALVFLVLGFQLAIFVVKVVERPPRAEDAWSEPGMTERSEVVAGVGPGMTEKSAAGMTERSAVDMAGGSSSGMTERSAAGAGQELGRMAGYELGRTD